MRLPDPELCLYFLTATGRNPPFLGDDGVISQKYLYRRTATSGATIGPKLGVPRKNWQILHELSIFLRSMLQVEKKKMVAHLGAVRPEIPWQKLELLVPKVPRNVISDL